jgi:hypothetical protein
VLSIRPRYREGDLATERTSEVQDLRGEVDAPRRAALEMIVPVYKSIDLTTRCVNSLADHILEISTRDPRLIVIDDSLGEPDVPRTLDALDA